MIIHEIGHNWQDDVKLRAAIIKASDWIRSPTGLLEDAINRKDGVDYRPALEETKEWFFDKTKEFVDEYSKTNPDEDIAQSFTAYFSGNEYKFKFPTEKMTAIKNFINRQK